MTRRQWHTWFIVFAVTVRAMIAPGFMIAPAVAADGLPTIVICTAQGMKLMVAGRDGQLQAAKPAGTLDHMPGGEAGGDSSSCPFGAPPAGMLADLPPVDVQRDVIAIRHDARPTAALIAHRVRFRLARGPPANLV